VSNPFVQTADEWMGLRGSPDDGLGIEGPRKQPMAHWDLKTLAAVLAMGLAGGWHGCVAPHHHDHPSSAASRGNADRSASAKPGERDWESQLRAAEEQADAAEEQSDNAEAKRSADRGRSSVYADGGMSLWTGLPASDEQAASENIQQVSSTREGADFDVAADPTGGPIAFASTRHRETADLYLKSTASSTVTQLTADPANDVMPAFGPEGERIAFASDREGDWNLYLLELSGGQPIQLTRNPADEVHPSWSPDGERIAFSSRGSSGRWEIVIVDVNNPSRRRIIGPGLFPRFSPDGKKLAFQRPRRRGARTFSIWTMDLENGEGRRPTEIAASPDAAMIGPTWSPDGQRLAFATVMPAGQRGEPSSADLWAVNLDGSGRMKLTGDEHVNVQPAWSPDGQIYFISDRTDWENVWSLTPPDGMMRTASPEAEPAGEPQAAASER